MELLTRPIPARSYVTDFIRDLGIADLEKGPWIAGGAARAVYQQRTLGPSGDIDIFVRDKAMGDAALKAVLDVVKGTRNVETNRQATTNVLGSYPYGREMIAIKVQVIGNVFFSDSVEDLYKTFDFTVCQFATDGRHVVYTPEAAHDAQKRVLRLSKTWVNRTRPSRVVRYFNYGFTPEESFLREALRMHERAVGKDLIIENAY
jgi:hypothetical protein